MKLVGIEEVFDEYGFVGTRREYKCTYSEAAYFCGVRGLGMAADTKMFFIHDITDAEGGYVGHYFAGSDRILLWEGNY